MTAAAGDNFTAWEAAHARGELWNAPVQSGLAKFASAYTLGELVGRGGFGDVHVATHNATGNSVAAKIVEVPSDLARTEHNAYENSVRHEIDMLRRLAHPCIISLIEAFESDKSAEKRQWILVLELCRGADLQALLDKYGALEMEDARAIAYQLTRAVCHMHEHGVVHRDIKPANVMVLGADLKGSRTQIKVLDFGLAYGMGGDFVDLYRRDIARRTSLRQLPAAQRKERQAHIANVVGHMKPVPQDEHSVHDSVHDSVHGSRHTRKQAEPNVVKEPSRMFFVVEPAGSRAYAAPEVQDRHRYVQAEGAVGGVTVRATVVVDAFSVGAMLRHMVTGVPPDHMVMQYIADRTSSPVSALSRLFKACAGRPVAHYRYLSQVDSEVSEVINRLTDPSPRTRMTMSQLLETTWMREEARLIGPASPAQVSVALAQGR